MSATTTVRQRRNSKLQKKGQNGKESAKKQNPRLCRYEELPDWQQDNDKILSGYVRETGSFRKCLESLTYMHNETVNIYTHLIPSATYLVLLMFFTDLFLIPQFPSTTMSDYIIINFYLLGAFLCLMCSSCFHCLKQQSETHSDLWSKVDYMGIIILISCSTVSILYYGFHDHLLHFKIFTVITVVLGSCCAAFVLNDRFNAKNWRVCRASFFIGFAFSGIVPIVTGVLEFGITEAFRRVQVKFVAWEAVFYIGGAVLYGFRIPESLAPGKFDLFGHSHQLFHVLVVLGSLCHFRAVLGSYLWVHTGNYYPNFLALK
ncbi:LAFE_0E02410g1_1 [Lachancea fermentati]|uniref:LAFE_0E02410g1_1 n=1 Tax=Lachancea fermentati TaxID=4955 RepID=A0A1G4MCM0_LACFM|nr:LAFE_0E02410g1_1 [Lachancea fermentati]